MPNGPCGLPEFREESHVGHILHLLGGSDVRLQHGPFVFVGWALPSQEIHLVHLFGIFLVRTASRQRREAPVNALRTRAAMGMHLSACPGAGTTHGMPYKFPATRVAH